MSPQLEVAKLDLNRLSCDLPDSVLKWDPNPNMHMGKGDLSLLTGNLYRCPPALGFDVVLAPTLGHDTSLYKHDATGETYECGGQAWYYPLIESAVAILALAAALARTWRKQRFAIVLREHYWRRRGRFWADAELGTATTNLAALACSNLFVSAIAVVAMLPLYLASGSRYKCQGSMEGILGYKHLTDDRLDLAIGAAVGMAAVVGLGWCWCGATASKVALAHERTAVDTLAMASDKDSEGLIEDETTGRRSDVLVEDDRFRFVEGAVEGAVEGSVEGSVGGAVEGVVGGFEAQGGQPEFRRSVHEPDVTNSPEPDIGGDGHEERNEGGEGGGRGRRGRRGRDRAGGSRAAQQRSHRGRGPAAVRSATDVPSRRGGSGATARARAYASGLERGIRAGDDGHDGADAVEKLRDFRHDVGQGGDHQGTHSARVDKPRGRGRR